MNDRELFAQLNNLKALKPSSSWVKAQREYLLSHITNVDGEVKTGFAPRFEEGFGFISHFMFAKPVIAVFGVFLLVLGSSVTVSASEGTLPGNFLYSVKIAAEKVELAVSPVIGASKGEIHIKHATKRIQELKTLNSTSLTNTPEEKEEQVKIVVNKLKEDVVSANASLDQSALESSSIESVDEIESKTSDLKKTIAQESSAMPESVKSDVQEVVRATQEVSDKALDVLVAKQADPETKETVDSEKLAEKIGQRIEDLNQNLVSTAGVGEKDAKSTATGSESVKAQDLFNDQIEKNITEAKTLLADGRLTEALDKVKEANNITQVTIEEGNINGEVKGEITSVAASDTKEPVKTVVPFVRKVVQPIVEEKVAEKPQVIQSSTGQAIEENAIMIPEIVVPAEPENNNQ